MKALATLGAAAVAALLAACAADAPVDPASVGPAPRVLVFGEQHDQRDQQRQVADAVRRLAAAGHLRAVVLEMAERGHDTRAVSRDAAEADARAALAWDDAGWPWSHYGPVVMAAVRAGVPVWGGNLPRAQVRPAMADTALDAGVPPELAARLDAAIRDGHCGLMPEGMGPGMRRVQLARDRSLAEAVADRLADGPGTVLLLAGAQHASRDRGVPWHLVRDGGATAHDLHVVMFDPADAAHRAAPADHGLVADERRPAAVTPSPDRCAQLRERLQRRPATP